MVTVVVTGSGLIFLAKVAVPEGDEMPKKEYSHGMEIFRKPAPSWAEAQPALRDWYQTGLGDAVLDTVSAINVHAMNAKAEIIAFLSNLMLELIEL